MNRVLRVEVPRVFLPLEHDARYLGAYGGRGSGKSHYFASKLVKRAIQMPGTRAVCIREIQRSLKQSVKQLIEDKITALDVEDQFEILESEIRGPGNGLIIFQGMQNHTAGSIKSLENFDVAWCEETQSLSQRSLNLLRPTIRKTGSQIWFSWNPEHETDPIDVFLRKDTPANATVVKANYLDNPWCPQELLDEADLDAKDPDKFKHVWLGDYRKAVEGAYYADCLRVAGEEGRVSTPQERDSILPIRASWDLGVSDATAIWVAQWVGGQIRFLDYIEGAGQPLSYYLGQLRTRGYPGCVCILPHDGSHRDGITALRYEDHVRAAGFDVEVVKNQGKGAAMQRIEAARRWFPRMWFDPDKTEPGRRALAQYHERKNGFGVGVGPEHDGASHAADAFGLMAVAYHEPANMVYSKLRRDKGWVL